MSMENYLNEFIDELIQEVEQELEEATATGNVAGYNTPFAFGTNRKKDKKKEKETATQAGYTLAEGIIQDREKQLKDLKQGGVVNGGGYGPFKKTGRDTFVSPKGKKYNVSSLIKLIGTFGDFKINESIVTEAKDEVTPKQLANLQRDIKKINPKIKVYISNHPITKGKLQIELGSDHPSNQGDDREITKINALLKKHTGDWRTGTMFTEGINEGPMDRIFGGIPYTKKGKQSIVTMKLPDDVKKRIIQRAKKEGKVAKPNFGGGVTVFESVIDEVIDKDDLKTAKDRLKYPHTIEDIEYRTTRRGDKFVKIIYKKKYVPGKMMDTGPHFVSVFYTDEKDLQNIGKALKLKLKESVNENLITERQLKGLEGIDNKTPLTKISDAQKLKIIQGTGNNISFKVPKGFDRNFWQVFSKGKIKKKKSLSGDIVYFLPGKIINSPNFKSEKDLINGVDWVAVEQTRRFNESVVNEGVLDIFKNEFKIALNFIKKTFGGSGVKISVKHIRPDIKYTDKYIEVLGPNGNSIRIQVSAYQTGWSEKVPASSALFPDFTDKKYGGSWSVKAYKKDSRDEMDTTKISSKTNQEYSVSIKSNRDAKKWVLGQLTKYISSHKDILKKFITEPISESVNEAKIKRPVNRWLELKNDETMHPHKKMAHGLKELKYQLAETEKFFKWYNKIKNINELESSNYWKRTQNHIYKIKERLVNIARTIQEIEK